MSLATTGLFSAKLSKKIEEEWIGSLEANRPDLKGKLLYRRDQMRCAVLDWEVPEAAWQPSTASLQLPDPADVHVLAAAIAGHADCIVTSNIKHFPGEIVTPYAIEVLDPDQFIVCQWDLDNVVAIGAFKRMRARRKKPEESAEDFAQTLERNGLPATASRLREAAELI